MGKVGNELVLWVQLSSMSSVPFCLCISVLPCDSPFDARVVIPPTDSGSSPMSPAPSISDMTNFSATPSKPHHAMETLNERPPSYDFQKPASSNGRGVPPSGTHHSACYDPTSEVVASPPESFEFQKPRLCHVCGAPAGRHNYYGGQVCASCRAFFRRSVRYY